MKTQFLIASCLGMAIFSGMSSAQAASFIRIMQESSPGSGNFGSISTGMIQAFTTHGTTAEYYQYGKKFASSFSGSLLGLQTGRSHLFFVQASDGLSLFVVHSTPNNGTGGAAQMQVLLFGDTARLKFVDDIGEATSNAAGTVFNSNHAWLNCCTDGFALGSLDGNWQMDLQFLANPRGLNSWAAYSADGKIVPLSLQPGRKIRLRQAIAQTPEPSVLFSLALLGFGAVAKGRKSLTYVEKIEK